MKYSIGKTSESDSTQIKTKISILQDMEVGDWGWDICEVISFCLIESIWVRCESTNSDKKSMLCWGQRG